MSTERSWSAALSVSVSAHSAVKWSVSPKHVDWCQISFLLYVWEETPNLSHSKSKKQTNKSPASAKCWGLSEGLKTDSPAWGRTTTGEDESSCMSHTGAASTAVCGLIAAFRFRSSSSSVSSSCVYLFLSLLVCCEENISNNIMKMINVRNERSQVFVPNVGATNSSVADLNWWLCKVTRVVVVCPSKL